MSAKMRDGDGLQRGRAGVSRFVYDDQVGLAGNQLHELPGPRRLAVEIPARADLVPVVVESADRQISVARDVESLSRLRTCR